MFNLKKHLISFISLLIFSPILKAQEIDHTPYKIIVFFDKVISFLSANSFIQFYSFFILFLFMFGLYQTIKNRHQNLIKNIAILLFNFLISISFLGMIQDVGNNKEKTISLYSKVIDLKFTEEHFAKVEKRVAELTGCNLGDYKLESGDWDCKGSELMSPKGFDFINVYWIMKLVYFCYFVFFGFFALVISFLIYISGIVLIMGVPLSQILSLRFIINKLLISPALKLNAVIIFNTGIMWALAYLLTQLIDINKTLVVSGVSNDVRSIILNYYFLIFTLLMVSQTLLAFCPRIINNLLNKIHWLFKKDVIQESVFNIDTSNFTVSVSDLNLDPRKKYRGSISYFDIPKKIVRKFSQKNKKLWFEFVYTTQEKLKENQKTILPDEASIILMLGKNSGKLYRIEVDNIDKFDEENLMFEIKMVLDKQIDIYKRTQKDELLSSMLNLLAIQKIIKSYQS